MARLSQLEQELESILPPMEADLEPIITDDSDFDNEPMESDLDNFEDFSDSIPAEEYPEEDDDSGFENYLLESLDVAEDDVFDESYGEGRRERRGISRNSKAISRVNKRAVGNSKNIIRTNRDLGKTKKLLRRTRKGLARDKKNLRGLARRMKIFQRKNAIEHRRINSRTVRNRRAIRVVARDAGKNRDILELIQLMVIPKIAGSLVSNQINELELEGTQVVQRTADGAPVFGTDANGTQFPILELREGVSREYEVLDQSNDFLSSLATVVPELTALVGRFTNVNKYVLVGIATLVTLLAGNKAIQRSSN